MAGAGPRRVPKGSAKLRGGQILKHWRESGPDWLPKRLRPYWKRVCCEMVDWHDLKFRADNDVLHLVAAALHDSEQGLDQETSDAATINARGRARAEYEERIKGLRELIQVRKNTAKPKPTKGGESLADIL